MGKHKEQQARLKEDKIKDKLWEETQNRMESRELEEELVTDEPMEVEEEEEFIMDL